MEGFDPLIHQSARLQIMAALNALNEESQMEFSALRELLGLTDGNLAAHLRKLEEAGYLAVEKTFVGRRPRTYLSLTAQGRRAFAAHVQALRKIIDLGQTGS